MVDRGRIGAYVDQAGSGSRQRMEQIKAYAAKKTGQLFDCISRFGEAQKDRIRLHVNALDMHARHAKVLQMTSPLVLFQPPT